jgi:hypothetical protein
MSNPDSNLEAFYAELDARMTMPDDNNWHNFLERRRKYCTVLSTNSERLAYPSLIANSTSGTSELFQSKDNPVHPAEGFPTVPMYMLFLQSTENDPHASLAGRVSAGHRGLNNPCL